jgi:cysteine-rich repeat protein
LKCPEGFYRIGTFCFEIWGDGYWVYNTFKQQYACDDGNINDNDGCDYHWRIEPGYKCTVVSPTIPRSYWQLTWGDGNLNGSTEDCDDGNEINGDGWSENCTVEDGYECDTGSPSFWSELWGNGRIDGVEECDDLNSMDLDGCSKDWKKEFNYNCTYDPTLLRDVCVTAFFPPVIIKNQINTFSNEIFFSFNDTMIGYNFSSYEVELQFTGPSNSYATKWTGNFISDYVFKLTFEVSPGIVGGWGEALTVYLSETTAFKSSEQIPINNSIEFNYYFKEIKTPKSVETTGKSASYMFIITFALSLTASVLTGGSMELMWSLANTLQIVYIWGMLSLFYPPHLKMAFSYMNYANFDNPLTSYMSDLLIRGIQIVSVPVSSQFETLGFRSTNILVNSLDKILLVILLFLLVVIIFLFFLKLKDKSDWFSRWVKKLDKSLRYESTSRFLVEMSLSLGVSWMINLMYGGTQKPIDWISYILAALIFIGILAILIYCIVFPVLNYSEIQTHPDHFERHSFIFLEFKRTKLKCILYYAYFILRRLGIAAVVVCLKDIVLVQCVCVTVLFFWMAHYSLVNKPFKSKTQNFLCWINETFLVFFSLMLFCFRDPSKLMIIKIAGFMCIGFLVIFFLLNWWIIFPLKVMDIFRLIREKCHKKTQREIEIEEETKVVRRPAIPYFRDVTEEMKCNLKSLNRSELNVEAIFSQNELHEELKASLILMYRLPIQAWEELIQIEYKSAANLFTRISQNN